MSPLLDNKSWRRTHTALGILGCSCTRLLRRGRGRLLGCLSLGSYLLDLLQFRHVIASLHHCFKFFATGSSVKSSVGRTPPLCIHQSQTLQHIYSQRRKVPRYPSLSIYYFLAEQPCGVGLAPKSFPCIPFSSSYFLVRALGRITFLVSLLLTRDRTTSEMRS